MLFCEGVSNCGCSTRHLKCLTCLNIGWLILHQGSLKGHWDKFNAVDLYQSLGGSVTQLIGVEAVKSYVIESGTCIIALTAYILKKYIVVNLGNIS